MAFSIAGCDYSPIDYTSTTDNGSASRAVDASVPACTAKTFYFDADKDGAGDPKVPFVACEQPAQYMTNKDDCNDAAATVKPGAPESCNKVDDDCNGKVDDTTSSWWLDHDHDGFGDAKFEHVNGCTSPDSFLVSNKLDCDDLDALKFPGLAETCDKKDNDCDGQVDEDAGNALTWIVDGDLDGHGKVGGSTVKSCEKPAGYAASVDDCNDGDSAVYATAKEQCDLKDNDCDGQTDEEAHLTFYKDVDLDGHGAPGTTISACTKPVGYATDKDDCNDGDAAIYQDATEVCGNKDNDCDKDVDEGVALEFYIDQDKDGFGSDSVKLMACKPGPDFVANKTDCNDGDKSAYPSAKETCDGVDNDCDGKTDELSDMCNDKDDFTVDACNGKAGCTNTPLTFTFECSNPNEFPAKDGYTCSVATFFTNDAGKVSNIVYGTVDKVHTLSAKQVCELLKNSSTYTLHVNSSVQQEGDSSVTWVGGLYVAVKDELGKKVKGTPGNVTILPPGLDFDFTVNDFPICKK
jgi:hypothetical protein